MTSTSHATDRLGTRPQLYDYTEGASAIDIDSALANNRRSRRDSHNSIPYGVTGGGSIFDGPGHAVNPSSVSRMSYGERGLAGRRSSEWSRRRSRDSLGSEGRGKLSRRLSMESQVLHGEDVEGSNCPSVDGQSGSDGEGMSQSAVSSHRRKSLSLPPSTSVFGHLSYLFRRSSGGEMSGQRPVLSRRSSPSSRHSETSDYALRTDDEGEERWGYSSGEGDNDDESVNAIDTTSTSDIGIDNDSYPPTPGASLPLLSSDPIFGDEARIDMDGVLETPDPPSSGPPSRQTIYVQDEDSTIRFIGFETITWRVWLWRLGCICTVGILGLLGHWFPRLWLRWVAQEKPFKDLKCGFVVVETAYRDITLFPIHILKYPYPMSTAFPAAVEDYNSQRLSRVPSTSSLFKANGIGEHQMLDELIVVDYRYSRFILDPRTGLFRMLRDWRDPGWTGLSSIQDGLQHHTRRQRSTLFGNNEMNIHAKSTTSLLVDEIIHPFYVFQIASVILWSLEDYWYYAFCITLISSLSVTTTLIETKKTIKKLREMSRFVCTVNVLIDGTWTDRESTALVPGDIIKLSQSEFSFFPADMFLLSGDCIINESMLTGESVPVSKMPAKDEDLVIWKTSKDISGESTKSFLYTGTRVVRIRGALSPDGSQGFPALALVVRTGFNTTKGALIRSMLFPKPMGFKFYRDSIRFVGVLAGIAGLGFCISAVQFVRLGVEWHTTILRALDLITVVVPPALPATLSIGTSFAIGRLRKLGIFCISPSRINVGGKVNLCCFDKTGTLTEDGLDILGVRGLDRNVQRFGELIENVYDLPMARDKTSFLYALTTCHSLKMVDGVVIGDPLDAKMFEFTKWTLEEGHVAGTGTIKGRSGEQPAALVQTVVRPPGSAQFRLEDALKGPAKHAHFLELGVIRTFDFVSILRRMSVVVKRLRSSSMEVYVKGAPEVMSDICTKDSFPQDYDDLLSYYTKRGYRVIAIAGKSIEGLTWLKAQRMKREQAESDLKFLGLIIFENKLKPGTAPVIQALRTAQLACRMITGDNPLTAVSVARECNLVNQAAHVFSPVFIQGNATTPLSKLEWSCMDDLSWKLDAYSLKPLTPPPHHAVNADAVDYQDYSLIITGDVFRWMINHAPLETLQRMLVKTQVYARMSPDEKHEVVERLQSLGYTVLMCGDGANDCAALKAADVGVSLSEAEASVAAPFTSSTPDISCILDVVREGRAALVTSFSCFKYMALYSMIQFTTITLLYSFTSSLGDFEFLYIDLFIIIPIAVTMSRTLPFPRIHPKTPTASLVSKTVLASIIGQIAITSAVQLWGFFWVRRQEWYIPQDSKKGDLESRSKNFENSTLFLLSCFQYILVAAVFSIGPPYRKSMWTNGWLLFSMVVLSIINLTVLLFPPKAVLHLLRLKSLPFTARTTLLLAAVINVVMSLAFEQWGTQAVARAATVAMRLCRGRRRVRDGKMYKTVEGMRF